MKVWVNLYYSWIKGKDKRAEREGCKHKIMQKIKEIYHNNDATPGYRTKCRSILEGVELTFRSIPYMNM